MEQEKRFSVRFPESVLEEVKQVARAENRSINSEIVWMVRTYLQERKGKPRHARQQKDQA